MTLGIISRVAFIIFLALLVIYSPAYIHADLTDLFDTIFLIILVVNLSLIYLRKINKINIRYLSIDLINVVGFLYIISTVETVHDNDQLLFRIQWLNELHTTMDDSAMPLLNLSFAIGFVLGEFVICISSLRSYLSKKHLNS